MDKSSEDETISSKQKGEKPSRWWMLYHLWCGICVKVFADISGLSKFILGVTSGSDHASASSYAGTATMVAIGAVALGYFLSKSLVNVIDRSVVSKKVRIVFKSILPVIYFIATAFFASVLEPLLAKSESVQRSPTTITQQSKIKPVRAFTTTQGAEGATELNLDQSALKGLETWIVETLLKKGRNKFAEMGHKPEDFKPTISANSVYINAGDKKLAVIKINQDSSMRLVTIIGIKEAVLLRVSCLRASNHDIPVWSGECGKEIQKTFGVSIQP
jgi:hypothetical protein